MHEGMLFGRIQGQGHTGLKVRNSSILCHVTLSLEELGSQDESTVSPTLG